MFFQTNGLENRLGTSDELLMLMVTIVPGETVCQFLVFSSFSSSAGKHAGYQFSTGDTSGAKNLFTEC